MPWSNRVRASANTISKRLLSPINVRSVKPHCDHICDHPGNHDVAIQLSFDSILFLIPRIDSPDS